MKTTDEFLSELRRLDVKLWVDGDRLRYRASKETLASVLTQLRERKAEILTFLQTANTAASSNLPPILPAPRNGKLLLSFAQQRLWFLEQFQLGSVYNIPVAYRLKGSLNVTALERSLGEVIRRHESLRTTFRSVDGEPSQAIAPDITLPLTVIKLQVPPDQREAEAQRKAIEEAQQPLDLAQGPLLRVKLLRLTEEEHVLLLTMHHIVSDGWSLEVFLRELTLLYKAFSTNQPSPLPELPIQYADFAHWQRQWLQGEVLESQLDYWKQQLGSGIPILQLPTDHPRPPVQTYRGAVQRLMLPKTLSEALKALSQRSGATLFMTLLTAFKILLYRYSGQEDIIIGSPTAGRNQVETEGMIGFFVNTVVMRTDLGGNPSFRELLVRVREVSLGTYAHQDLPFEKLVEELQPERDRSRSPLFQVMFALNPPWTAPDISLPGLSINSLFGYVHSGTAGFDLTLVMRDTCQGVRASLEYNTDLFDAATMTRMLGHFQTLLEGIVAEPEQRISDLPLLSAVERHQMLTKWNDTQAEYPKDVCIYQLFEAQVEKTPDAVAVVFENEQLTYQELNLRANQLAHYLRSLGVEPDQLVGICLERCLEMAVGFLGILKAGGAYLPLDPAYSSERLAFMLSDSLAPVLLSQQRLVGVLPDCSAQVVLLDADWEAIAQESQSNLSCEITPQNLAYIIYTSGSTGKPKGVMIPHQGLVNHNVAITRLCNLSQSDRVLQFSSISFDIAVEELFPTWISGATLVIRSQEMLSSTTNFLQEVEQERLTVLDLPTAFWHELLWGMSALKHPLPASVRLVIVGGEKASRSAYLTWLDLVGKHPRWLNTYGPTETTVTATVYDPAASDISAVSEIPIGRPLANAQVYILDRQLQPVPIGVPGELYIGGAGLARGYLNHPELTKEKFISNPFSDESGARLYKTGDLVRYLPDGNIEFLDRLDNQVKIRGFRVELGELESVLAQHPAVQQNVVIAREDVPGDKRLVAYIVPDQNQSPKVDELRSFLKQKLPPYMVPSAFVLLDALPLTPNGKVDRRILPTPDRSSQELEETFVASRDELELQLTKIWEEVLGIQPISVKDNFFDLGGHSLLAVRLFAQIEKTFDRNLPLVTLFQAPTVEQLTNILRQQEWSAPWSPLVTIQAGGSKPPLFCVHGGGFNVIVYRDLAINLGPDQPVYGLQAQGLDGNNEPLHYRIEDIAADYIKQIQTVQLEGPYLLAGLSSGGNIAFEMAQQLHSQGQKVVLLAMLDTFGPNSVKLLPPIPRLFSSLYYAFRYSTPRFVSKLVRLDKVALRKALGDVRAFKKSGVEQRSKATENQIKAGLQTDSTQHSTNTNYLERWLNNLSMFILEHSPWAFFSPTAQLQEIEGSLPDTIRKLEEAHRKAQKVYAPKAYPGLITLFRASESPPGFYLDPQLGWGKIATGGIEIYKNPGHHTSIVQSPVLANKMRGCIDKALADTPNISFRKKR